MPELPEVETMCRGILAIVGGVVQRLDVPRGACKPIRIQPQLRELRRRIAGQEVTGIGRKGKRVLVQLANRHVLVFEPRMTGLVLLSTPPDRAHVRVILTLLGSPAPQLVYWDRRGLGSVRLLSPGEQAREFSTDRLGPDALDVDVDELKDRFAGSRSPIKVALMDQGRIAGIGNLYASEILFVARIHPATPCAAIRTTDWPRLHAAVRMVLEEAISYEGSTLGDGTYRNALNQQGRYQNHHRVYQKEGTRCPVCRRGTIRRIVQAQRSTFYCPSCQRNRPSR